MYSVANPLMAAFAKSDLKKACELSKQTDNGGGSSSSSSSSSISSSGSSNGGNKRKIIDVSDSDDTQWTG